MNWLSKVFGVLGKITDVLLKGRQAGLWSEKSGATPPRTGLDQPAKFEPPKVGGGHL